MDLGWKVLLPLAAREHDRHRRCGLLVALDDRRRRPLSTFAPLALVVGLLVVVAQRNPVDERARPRSSALCSLVGASTCSSCAPVHRDPADHRLRRRDHGAVPVRHHAAEPATSEDPARDRGRRGLGWIAGGAVGILLAVELRRALRDAADRRRSRPLRAVSAAAPQRSAASLLSPTTCSRSRSPRSCCSSRWSARSSSPDAKAAQELMIPSRRTASDARRRPVRDRRRRRRAAPQRDRHLHVDRADAERRRTWRSSRFARQLGTRWTGR